MRAVIRIGRSRMTAPSTVAMAVLSPRLTRCMISSVMITPFCTEMPATAMKPTAADTDRCSPAMPRAARPPTSVNGTIASTMLASRTERKAQNRSVKISNAVHGTITIRRWDARCEFSNWPPHSRWYPGGSVTRAATAWRASSTKLPWSRANRLTLTITVREPDSRNIRDAP